MAVSFIDGGNRSTPRKPPTCHKSLTNFITLVIFGFAFYPKVQIFKKGNEITSVQQVSSLIEITAHVDNFDKILQNHDQWIMKMMANSIIMMGTD